MKVERILFAVDFARCPPEALVQLGELAARHHADVKLVHAGRNRGELAEVLEAGIRCRMRGIAGDAGRYLARCIDAGSATTPKLTLSVGIGVPPVTAVLRAAAGFEPDLVVMLAETGWCPGSSLPVQVARDVSAPVLVLRSGVQCTTACEDVEGVLVPFTFAPETKRAIELGLALARTPSGVTLLHVINPERRRAFADTLEHPELRAKINETLKSWGIDAHPRILIEAGVAPIRIAEASDARHAEIVVMARGQGSRDITDRVIGNAPVPVLVV